MDELTEKTIAHISDGAIHVAEEDKERWNGKADLALLNTEGYLKKKIVDALPFVGVTFDFSDGVSRFTPLRCCTAEVVENEQGEYYQKIMTAPDTENSYAFAVLDIGKYTAKAKEFTIEFDTKINGDRWYISLSDLNRRPGQSHQSNYDIDGVVFSQGTGEGSYYYINGDLTWKDSFFNGWVHSSVTVNFETKTAAYIISNESTAAALSGKIDFYDRAALQVTGLEVYSHESNIEMCVDNIRIAAKFGDGKDDERTVYIVSENGVFSEYIYINGKPILMGRSDISEMVKEVLSRLEALENN